MTAGRDRGPETPSFAGILQMAIEDALSRVFTYMPAEVVKYDDAAQKADIKVCLKKKYYDGTVKEYPIIANVPVEFQRAGLASIIVPVKVGTSGSIKIMSRSIDAWKKSGGCPDPNDTRRFNLTDAVFVPGLYPFSDPATVDDPDAVTIQNDQAVIELLPDGKFKFRKRGGDEVLDLLVQISDRLRETCAQLEVATTNTIFGALQLNNFAQFAILKTQVDDLKDRLDELRGA